MNSVVLGIVSNCGVDQGFDRTFISASKAIFINSVSGIFELVSSISVKTL